MLQLEPGKKRVLRSVPSTKKIDGAKEGEGLSIIGDRGGAPP